MRRIEDPSHRRLLAVVTTILRALLSGGAPLAIKAD